MAIINRVARLFSADLNALLDRIEEPEILLRQAVRDMHNELDEMRRRAASLDRQQLYLERESASLRRSAEQVAEELELCLDADEEALARSLVRRQIEIERNLTHLAREHENSAEALAMLRQHIADGDAELTQRREQLDLYSTRDSDSLNRPRHADKAGTAISDADVDIALLRIRQRRVGA